MNIEVVIQEIFQLLSPLPISTPTYINLSLLVVFLLLPSKANRFQLNSRLQSLDGDLSPSNNSSPVFLTPSFLLIASFLENKKLKFLPSLRIFYLFLIIQVIHKCMNTSLLKISITYKIKSPLDIIALDEPQTFTRVNPRYSFCRTSRLYYIQNCFMSFSLFK